MNQNASQESCSKNGKLTDAQKARIEKNKQRALELRQARLAKVKRSTTDAVTDSAKHFKKDDVGLLACQKDTGAGFFRDEEYEEDFTDEMYPVILEEMPPPVLGGDELTQCVDCKKEFTDSQLLKNFDILVCDNCRDSDKHKLCTKTEAKQNYLLKDCDLDMRTPILKFILKKNPHNDRWGQMKLYYKPHIIARAIEVWGSLDNLEDQKEQRIENKEKSKQKNYEKRIKEMRRAVRTSTWKKVEQKHEHEYDSENETYDEDEDEYSKKCKTCGHVLTYEKM